VLPVVFAAKGHEPVPAKRPLRALPDERMGPGQEPPSLDLQVCPFRDQAFLTAVMAR
jgi:hypothetical protein